MKVVLLFMLMTLVLATRGEYRYKIRGPPPPPAKPLPPRPPMSSHFGSSKPSHGHVFFSKGKPLNHRFVSRPHLHAVPHFHSMVSRPLHGAPVGPQGHHFKSPSAFLLGSPSWKGDAFSLGHSFRAPSIKETFLPSPPSDFDFKPPKPQAPLPSPLTTHITNSLDDDKGPIHTIPAPNLGPSGNHHHHFQQHQQHIHQKPQTSFLEIEKVPIAHVGTSTLSLHQAPSHGYEVHEPSNDHAGHTLDGQPTYFAPDPDPSLPAPKVPTTTDPHSLPSNGRIPSSELLQQTPIGLQVLDTSGGLGFAGNSLSSQELVQLLNHQSHQPPQMLDSFGVAVPQLQQHFLQTTSLYSPSGTHFLSPEFQTFNYEEQRQQQQQQQQQQQESEASENIPTIIKNVPLHFHNYEAKANSVAAEEDAYYDVPAEASTVNQVDYEEDQNEEQEEGGVPISTTFYTTLPNRQVAETLASLAAAGNINSNLANGLKQQQQGNIQEESQEGYPEQNANIQVGTPEGEEYEDYGSESQQDEQQYQQRPHEQQYQQQRYQQYEQQNSQYQQQKLLHTQQKYETLEDHTSPVDYEEEDNNEQQEVDEEVASQQSKATLQFGARIRPKRT